MVTIEIVMFNPVSNFVIRLIKRNEIILPNASLLETPKESLNHSVLFQRVHHYRLLMKSILGYCLMKLLRSEHKAIVGSNHKTMRLWYDVLSNQRIFKGSGRDGRFPGSREPPADQISIGTVDY